MPATHNIWGELPCESCRCRGSFVAAAASACFHHTVFSLPPLPLPCSLKAPTVSRLHGDAGYAIQIAAEAAKVPVLVPKIKELGGSDIVVTSIRMLVA